MAGHAKQEICKMVKVCVVFATPLYWYGYFSGKTCLLRQNRCSLPCRLSGLMQFVNAVIILGTTAEETGIETEISGVETY
jgi:hypothetical protein